MSLAVDTPIAPQFPILPLEEQVDLAEKHKLDTLLFCSDPLTLRHVLINQDTGEVAEHDVIAGTAVIVGLARSINGGS